MSKKYFIWMDSRYCYDNECIFLNHYSWSLFFSPRDCFNYIRHIIDKNEDCDIICSCPINDQGYQNLCDLENYGVDFVMHFHFNDAHPFKYNDPEDIRTIIEENGWQVLTNDQLIELLHSN